MAARLWTERRKFNFDFNRIRSGLRRTGWGHPRSRKSFGALGNGVISVPSSDDWPSSLQFAPTVIITFNAFVPNEAAVEETFVNKSPKATLK